MAEEKQSPTETTQSDKTQPNVPEQSPLSAYRPTPVKKEFIEKAIQVLEDDESQKLVEAVVTSRQRQAPIETPWILEQFFNGQIDLDAELALRFTSMPVMSTVKFRHLGQNQQRGIATLATQDGAAQVLFEVDKGTSHIFTTFSVNSMLGLRFNLKNLVDRTQWLNHIRREEGGLAFLWSASRWEQDYILCVAKRYYMNVYAFSPNGLEAGARLTPEVGHKLLHWLENHWGDEAPSPAPTNDMLTW